PKCSKFTGARGRRELFAKLNRALIHFQASTIQICIRPVFRASAIHILTRAGAEPEKVASSPVVDVVLASIARDDRCVGKITFGWADVAFPTCEVRDLVLEESSLPGGVDQYIVHVAGQLFVGFQLTG